MHPNRRMTRQGGVAIRAVHTKSWRFRRKTLFEHANRSRDQGMVLVHPNAWRPRVNGDHGALAPGNERGADPRIRPS